jgi:hypothetical protein
VNDEDDMFQHNETQQMEAETQQYETHQMDAKTQQEPQYEIVQEPQYETQQMEYDTQQTMQEPHEDTQQMVVFQQLMQDTPSTDVPIPLPVDLPINELRLLASQGKLVHHTRTEVNLPNCTIGYPVELHGKWWSCVVFNENASKMQHFVPITMDQATQCDNTPGFDYIQEESKEINTASFIPSPETDQAMEDVVKNALQGLTPFLYTPEGTPEIADLTNF